MNNFFFRCSLILLIYCFNSCTKGDEVGCWKCTIKKTASEKTKTVCDKTLQEAMDLMHTEENIYFGSDAVKITCEQD